MLKDTDKPTEERHKLERKKEREKWSHCTLKERKLKNKEWLHCTVLKESRKQICEDQTKEENIK